MLQARGRSSACSVVIVPALLFTLALAWISKVLRAADARQPSQTRGLGSQGAASSSSRSLTTLGGVR
jgi:hypothetical protein